MWQQDDILYGLQFVRHIRLFFKDVEARGKDGARFEGGDQGLLVDDRAARDIDDHATRTELLHDIGVDHLRGAGAARNDDDERIHRLRHFDQVGIVLVRYTIGRFARV